MPQGKGNHRPYTRNIKFYDGSWLVGAWFAGSCRRRWCHIRCIQIHASVSRGGLYPKLLADAAYANPYAGVCEGCSSLRSQPNTPKRSIQPARIMISAVPVVIQCQRLHTPKRDDKKSKLKRPAILLWQEKNERKTTGLPPYSCLRGVLQERSVSR